MEKKYTGRFAIILAVLFVALLGIFPPSRVFDSSIPWAQKLNLKPGIDISGGTSLVYEIQVPAGDAATDLSQRVADSLKKRVDPDGVRNLVWRPQGPTRLEIQMPLTAGSTTSRAAREAFSIAQQVLERTNVRVASVYEALKLADAPAKQKALDDLAMGSTARKAMFARLDQLVKDLAEAQKAGDPKRTVDTKDEIAKVEAQIEATNLSAARLQSELDLASAAIERATKEGKKDLLPQRQKERDEKLGQFKKAADFPSRLAAIDDFAVRHDAYMEVKGAVDDAEGLKRLLRGSGVLEFHIAVTDQQLISQKEASLKAEGPTVKPGDTMRWYEVDRPDEMKGHQVYAYGDKRWMLVYITSGEQMVHHEGQTTWGLEWARRTQDPRSGETVVEFQFDAAGAALFGDLTGSHINQPLAIVLDDKLISAPNINSQIFSTGTISGNFTSQELDYLIRTLNAGSLPARLHEEPVMERTVSPTLGADNLRRGLYSSFMAVVVVGVFMTSYYHFGGFVATIAVLMNVLIQIGLLAMFNATFTLPGIAALALTVGMAVDANVLIFERLREEQHRGLSLRMAIRNAYDRAFSAIIDSHVTTMCTSVILYWKGSEEVRGFGLTLLIGVIVSLFTSTVRDAHRVRFLARQARAQAHGQLPAELPRLGPVPEAQLGLDAEGEGLLRVQLHRHQPGPVRVLLQGPRHVRCGIRLGHGSADGAEAEDGHPGGARPPGQGGVQGGAARRAGCGDRQHRHGI